MILSLSRPRSVSLNLFTYEVMVSCTLDECVSLSVDSGSSDALPVRMRTRAFHIFFEAVGLGVGYWVLGALGLGLELGRRGG